MIIKPETRTSLGSCTEVTAARFDQPQRPRRSPRGLLSERSECRRCDSIADGQVMASGCHSRDPLCPSASVSGACVAKPGNEGQSSCSMTSRSTVAKSGPSGKERWCGCSRQEHAPLEAPRSDCTSRKRDGHDDEHHYAAGKLLPASKWLFPRPSHGEAGFSTGSNSCHSALKARSHDSACILGTATGLAYAPPGTRKYCRVARTE